MADTVRIWIIGGGKPAFEFDAVLRESHSSELVVTENPVEDGVTVADHAYMMPDRLEIEGGVGDVWLGMRDPQNLRGAVSSGLDSGVLAGDLSTVLNDLMPDRPWLAAEGSGDTASRSQRAYQLLRGLMRSAEPFDVQTGLMLYKSMVVKTLTAEQDKDTSAVLYFRAGLVEVIRRGTQAVVFPPRKPGKTARQGAPKVDKGDKKPADVTKPAQLQSILDSFINGKVDGASTFTLPQIPIIPGAG